MKSKKRKLKKLARSCALRYLLASQAIADLFRKARRSAPTVVFFDEIDALAGNRAGGGGGSTGVSGPCSLSRAE